MGCDIHCYLEVFKDGKWVSADEWESYDYGEDEKGKTVPYGKSAYDGRNYNLFGILAGVRKRDFEFEMTPRGMPFDVSNEVNMANKHWDSDGHSHSYLYLHELRSLKTWIAKQMMPVSGMKNIEELKALKASIASDKPDYGLLYPYCQMTNDTKQAEFNVEIPADYMVGECLETIINSFDGIDGENHRLVFWFDN